MKVIFMGTPVYAQKILEELIRAKDMEVAAVYTQPDKPVGRKKVMTAPPVKITAERAGIKTYQPEKLKDKEVIDELLKIECDFIVVAAYGQILPPKILNHAPCINLHASILPKYRGASPIQEAILNGDTHTGVTAMKMDEGLDTGDIIKISKTAIDDDEMVSTLFEKLTHIAADLTLDVLRNYESYKQEKQVNKEATNCSKITKADGEIEFEDAVILYNKYRAFTPWPGIYLKSGLKLKEIMLRSACRAYDAGKILEINDDHIVVGCTLGAIKIYRVQPASKKEMDILSYINGKHLKVEDYLS
ncbi:methionyl-tRNA formyltransferase [Sulfurimonas sp. HSL-1716]|uniref:methionyl-tRNA formyltransferase n=1 Tax=Hydrocurvibacter sulfurireducens TaxID=3131937 RepID=UPI0031F9823F